MNSSAGHTVHHLNDYDACGGVKGPTMTDPGANVMGKRRWSDKEAEACALSGLEVLQMREMASEKRDASMVEKMHLYLKQIGAEEIKVDREPHVYYLKFLDIKKQWMKILLPWTNQVCKAGDGTLSAGSGKGPEDVKREVLQKYARIIAREKKKGHDIVYAFYGRHAGDEHGDGDKQGTLDTILQIADDAEGAKESQRLSEVGQGGSTLLSFMKMALHGRAHVPVNVHHIHRPNTAWEAELFIDLHDCLELRTSVGHGEPLPGHAVHEFGAPVQGEATNGILPEAMRRLCNLVKGRARPQMKQHSEEFQLQRYGSTVRARGRYRKHWNLVVDAASGAGFVQLFVAVTMDSQTANSTPKVRRKSVP